MRKMSTSFAEKILTEDIKQKLNNSNLPLPSMSYGVYISYYKHPMGEALAAANNLLYKAKNNGRNRIEFAIRKHSGQSIESFIDKNNDLKNKKTEPSPFSLFFISSGKSQINSTP